MHSINGPAPHNNPYSSRILLIAALFGLVAFLISLYVSSSGRFMGATHGDWANHAATTRAIFLGEDFNSPIIKRTLNEFVNYPKLTYVAGAGIARLASISPLQGLSIVVQLSVIVACLFFSLRLVAVLAYGKRGKASLVLSFMLMLFLFFGVQVLSIGFRSQVMSNSFLSQAASIALANVFLYAAVKKPKVKWLVFVMLVAAWALINTHIVGFLWCGFSLVLMALGLPDVRAKIRIATAIAGSVIFAVFLVATPGVLDVFRIAGTGGDLRAYMGQNLSDYTWIFVLFLVLYFLALVTMVARARLNMRSYQEFAWGAAGFLSLGPLILASAMTVYAKGGNWYPVMKWVYVFFPEVLIALAFIVSRATLATVAGESVRPSTGFVIGLLAVSFLIQEPLLPPAIDLTPAILAEQGTRTQVVEGARDYPGLRVDHPALNYFIAKAVLKIPMDEQTVNWMNTGATKPGDLGPADFKAVGPTIAPAEVIPYRLGSSIAQRTLTNQWWPLELDHVWAAKTPATVFFVAARPPKAIHIAFVPFMPGGPGSRNFRLSLNGTPMPELRGTAMDWSAPTSYSAAIPPGIIKPDGRITLVLSWDPIAKDDLGIALVAIAYQ